MPNKEKSSVTQDHASPRAKPDCVCLVSLPQESRAFPSEHRDSWRRPCLLTFGSEAHTRTTCYMKNEIGSVDLNPRGQRAHSKPDAQEPRIAWAVVHLSTGTATRTKVVTVVVLLSGSCSLLPALFLSPHLPLLPISAVGGKFRPTLFSSYPAYGYLSGFCEKGSL